VGDEVISGAEFQRDLRQRWRMKQAESAAIYRPGPDFKRETLEELINGRVLRLLARNAGVEVSDKEVEEDFALHRRAFPSPQEYERFLKEYGYTEATLRGEIRQKLLIKRYLNEHFPAAAIEEAELLRAYEEAQKRHALFRAVETFDYRYLFVHGPRENAQAHEAAAQQVADAHRRILAGARFEDVAREISQDAVSAERGGLYTETPLTVLPEPVAKEVAGMAIGQLSEPIPSDGGWHLVCVIARHPPGAISFDEARASLTERLQQMKREIAVAEAIRSARTVLRVQIDDTALAAVPLESGT
jgi:parvulin-like peptidyl-prolyl isomerase